MTRPAGGEPMHDTPTEPPANSTAQAEYDKALAFWFGRVNYEQRTPRPTDLKLDRMRELLARLGDPHQRLRIIHVAGSKGKGSTSAMLAAVLHSAGYRTGLFTSPHLVRVEERIQIDGEPVHPDELAALLRDVRPVVEAMDAESSHPPVTFFEVGTALGFLHFVRRRVDVAVVEVGLGGRFDSTNVCQPWLSVITSISFDHTQQLGNRLASIAFEKAGIVKPGRPVVSGVAALEARPVIEQVCRERRSPLRQLGVDFRYAYEPALFCLEPVGKTGKSAPPKCRPRVRITTKRRAWPALELGLMGEHQAANAAVAVACVEQLCESGWHVPDAAVAVGLATVDWPARLEVVGHRPLVLLDCAHNVASAEALVATLRASLPHRLWQPGVKRFLVFGGSGDKDLLGMFSVLAPHFTHAYLTRFHSPRSQPPEALAEVLRQVSDLTFTTCHSSAAVLQAARADAGPDDLICITGSVFLAGELRPLLVGPVS